MKARELLAHFHALIPEHHLKIDPAATADRVVLGDPEREVRRVMVTWMSTTAAVREAAERGCDALITHEGTMWGREPDVLDDPRGSGGPVVRPGETKPDTIISWTPGTLKWERAVAKRRYLESTGIVIIRLHDVWDLLPEVGIPWAWARHLGLAGRPVAFGGVFGEHHRYDIEPVALDELARRIAERTAPLGEPAVQVFGDGRRRVSKVGVGTGCGANVFDYLAIGCDVGVICDDTWESRCFVDLAFAIDNEFSMIRVNHGTSEEPGMASLARYLREHFPGLDVHHRPQGSCYRVVGTAEQPPRAG